MYGFGGPMPSNLWASSFIFLPRVVFDLFVSGKNLNLPRHIRSIKMVLLFLKGEYHYIGIFAELIKIFAYITTLKDIMESAGEKITKHYKIDLRS